MLHPILKYRHGSTLFAETFDPCAGTRSIVSLGGDYDPIYRLRLGRVGKVRVVDVDATFRRLNIEMWQGTSCAKYKFVPFGELQ
jgi:hypothetical protein